MIVKKSFIYLSVCFLFLSASLSAFSGNEKSDIDAYSTECFKSQIAEICDYVEHVLKENPEARYSGRVIDSIFSREEEVDDDVADDPQFHMLYGGLQLLCKFKNKNEPDALDLLESTEIASVIFSPELISISQQDTHGYMLYQNMLEKKNLLIKAGRYFLSHNSSDFSGDKYFDKRRYNATFRFFTQFFTPMICKGDEAVYSEEAFIYALSKGIFLFGLDHRINSVHGGLYRYPAYLLAHDFAHHCDLIRPQIADEAGLLRMAQNIVALAGRLYTKINDPVLVSQQERPKAIRAAFYLLHENQLYLKAATLSVCSPQDVDDIYDITFDSFIETFSSRMHSVSQLKPNAHSLVRSNDWYYEERTASDYAEMMVNLYPDKETEIFGDGTEDRALVFHAELVMNLTVEMMYWFYEKVM